MLRTFEIHLGSLEFNRALEAIWSLVQLGNQYIDKSAPWTLAKKPEDKPRLNTVLYNAAETLRFLCLALYPFMPQAAEEMKRQLGLVLNFSKPLLSAEITWGGVLPGTEIAKGSPLFPRIDTTKTQGDARVTQDQQPAPSPTDQITIDEFRKVSLRVGLVIAAERVPKSTKLLKLQVDIGTERRQVVPEYQRLVVLRLGKVLERPKGPGIVILIPLVDKAMRVDLREKYTEIPHQTCITKDNASISVDFLIYSKVVDPIASFVQVQDFDAAAEGIAVTTLRAVVGDIALDDVLAKREEINHVLQTKMDQVTTRWGVKITTFEVAKGVDAKTMSLQYLEALKSLGASPATKFVLPLELTSLLSGVLGDSRKAFTTEKP